MTVIEQAQALQTQAIEIQLTERDSIDAHLAQLGHCQDGKNKLGSPRRSEVTSSVTLGNNASE